jgi:hypothetical protein
MIERSARNRLDRFRVFAAVQARFWPEDAHCFQDGAKADRDHRKPSRFADRAIQVD